MQAINRWRNWKPTVGKSDDSPIPVLPKPTKPTSVSFVSAIPGQTQNFSYLCGIPPDEPDAWEPSFTEWIGTHCAFRERCFGEIGGLHVYFAEWCAAGDSVVPCARPTFERLLANAGFIMADGLVSGLILLEDAEAAEYWKHAPGPSERLPAKPTPAPAYLGDLLIPQYRAKRSGGAE